MLSCDRWLNTPGGNGERFIADAPTSCADRSNRFSECGQLVLDGSAEPSELARGRCLTVGCAQGHDTPAHGLRVHARRAPVRAHGAEACEIRQWPGTSDDLRWHVSCQWTLVMMNDETFSGIKVLVALAQADGRIHVEERVAIENALDGAELPDRMTVARLLSAPIDLGAELSRIRSNDARKRTYAAACALVCADGEVSREERSMLARVASVFGLDDAELVSLSLISKTPPSGITSEPDRAKRERLVEREIAAAAAFGALLASTSLPIAPEACLFTNNVRLARNIDIAYGHDASDRFWRTFVVNVVGAAAPGSAIAMLLELFPRSCEAAGAAAHATTFALGEATRLYFDQGERIEPSELRRAFLGARRAAQQTRDAAVAVAAQRAELDAAMDVLAAMLADGELTEHKYASRLVALAPLPSVWTPVRLDRAA